MTLTADETCLDTTSGLAETLDALYASAADASAVSIAPGGERWNGALGACCRYTGANEIVVTVGGATTRWVEPAHRRATVVELGAMLTVPLPEVTERALSPTVGATVRFRFGSLARREAAERSGRVETILSHLERLLLLHGTLARTRHEQVAMRGIVDRLSVGVCLLERDRRVVVANDSARTLLLDDDPLSLDDNARLCCVDPLAQAAFERAIVKACDGAADADAASRLALDTVAAGGGTIVLEIERHAERARDGGAGGRALLTLIDPAAPCEPRLGRLCALHALSGAESEVLGLMVAGLTNRQIAAARHVGSETVRTQVTSVLRKLGISRRSELFRKVAATSPVWHGRRRADDYPRGRAFSGS